MRYGDFLGSLLLASSHSGGFPYSVEHMAGEGQPAQAARPNIIHVYTYTEHAQFIDVS